eukprot:351323-Chlamydomonas_euryale.AAC.18
MLLELFNSDWQRVWQPAPLWPTVSGEDGKGRAAAVVAEAGVCVREGCTGVTGGCKGWLRPAQVRCPTRFLKTQNPPTEGRGQKASSCLHALRCVAECSPSSAGGCCGQCAAWACPQVYIWLDLFAVNQYTEVGAKRFLPKLDEVLSDAVQNLLVLDMVRPFGVERLHVQHARTPEGVCQ